MSDSTLKRFGVSMESHLLEKFDQFVQEKGYENRSEALRDLIRDALIQSYWENEDQIVAGSILLFYNHHQRNLLEEITSVQHGMHEYVLATTHFHLDHDNCLELIVVKGKASILRQFTYKLMSLKGVKYTKFTVAPVEEF